MFTEEVEITYRSSIHTNWINPDLKFCRKRKKKAIWDFKISLKRCRCRCRQLRVIDCWRLDCDGIRVDDSLKRAGNDETLYKRYSKNNTAPTDAAAGADKLYCVCLGSSLSHFRQACCVIITCLCYNKRAPIIIIILFFFLKFLSFFLSVFLLLIFSLSLKERDEPVASHARSRPLGSLLNSILPSLPAYYRVIQPFFYFSFVPTDW